MLDAKCDMGQGVMHTVRVFVRTVLFVLSICNFIRCEEVSADLDLLNGKIALPPIPSISENQSKTPDTLPTTYRVPDKVLNVTTLYPENVWYPTGDILCVYFNKEFSNLGLHCKSHKTTDFVEAFTALRSGKTDFVLTTEDLGELTFNGVDDFDKGVGYKKLRFVFALNDALLVMLAKRSAEFDDIGVLGGKVIGVNKSSMEIKRIFQTISSTEKWGKPVSYMDLNTAGEDALCNEKVDVVAIFVKNPNVDVQTITKSCETRLVEIHDDDIEILKKSNPMYSSGVISGGMYMGSPMDVKTIGIRSVVLSSADVPEETVYNLTKAFFNHVESFRMLHPAFEGLAIEWATKTSGVTPMHDGVKRYLKETHLNTVDVSTQKGGGDQVTKEGVAVKK